MVVHNDPATSSPFSFDGGTIGILALSFADNKTFLKLIYHFFLVTVRATKVLRGQEMIMIFLYDECICMMRRLQNWSYGCHKKS